MPVFPFFVINLLMGLTTMKARTFYWVSQLGMLAGTLVYVNAGTQLAQIESLQGILSPGLIGSFVLLGLFPLIAKKIVDAVQRAQGLCALGRAQAEALRPQPGRDRRRRRRAGHRLHRRRGEGQGDAGREPQDGRRLPELRLRAEQGADPHRQAGAPDAPRADYGIAAADAELDFAQVMERVARVVRDIEPHDSVERYTGLGVEVLQGHATIVDPWHVEIAAHDGGAQTLTTRSIVIATGARPFVPPLPGLDDVGYSPATRCGACANCRARLVVLGGGPIGCELAQSFARLGSQVTQVEMAPRIMMREDEEVSACARKALRSRRRGGAHRPQGAALREAGRRQDHRRRSRRAANSASTSTSCSAPWAASRA